MFPPHQHHHHQPKRRKKRPIHGVKTVDVTRGKSGYGFTISGQHPCVLSCIVNNSPAELMGLHPGNYLMSVNGIDVSKHGHDEVVRMVGISTGTLTIQVAENYNSSDSSDEEFVHRTKQKYPNRVKRNHRGYGEKMDKILADINHRDRHCPDGHSHDPNVRPIPKMGNGGNKELVRSKSSRPRLHHPVGAENHEIQAEGMSYIEAGASNLFKVPFQKSVSTSNVPTAPSLPTHHRVEPKQAFIKSTSQSTVKSQTPAKPQSNHAHYGNARNHMYDNFSPNSLQQIINHSLHSYSAANEAFIHNEDDFDDEADDVPLRHDGGDIRIVVGYVGSLEMPGDANQPHVRVQSIRNAVRRLRVEKKIHTLVLMVVSSDIGVKLINLSGKEIAHYPIKRLAFSGVCPDDRRFFGIVTLPWVGSGTSSDSDERSEPASSSCHVFMVDQEMTAHNAHVSKARNFGIECTVDPQSQRCLEFPRSTTPIILSISNLYKDRPGGTIDNDMARSHVFANPAHPVDPVQHVRTSSSSSQNSNSDSGLGLGREDNIVEPPVGPVPMIVDMPPPPIPTRDRDRPQQQLPQIKWSGNTVHLMDGPVRQLTPATNKPMHRKSKSGSSLDFSQSHSQCDTSISSEDFTRVSDKLNPRAMPLPVNTPHRPRAMGDGLENQNAAENLRIGMQKLLQARQRPMGLDQTSSDTESRSSRGESILSSSNLRERPVSAPFKYLSNDSIETSKGEISSIKHDSDSSLADKLSPRAFLSSAFTPVGSVGSAFKKIRSRPLLHQMRSPSAPPIPNYHGDDDDSEEEAVNGIIKRLQKDKSLGSQTGGEPRQMENSYTQAIKRDQERKGVVPLDSPEVIVKSTVSNSTDKWTKGSLRQKSNRRNPLSLSHESLVVFEQDPLQHKLTSANSVNSIVNQVAKTIEQEEVGRVAGWAVNFTKLLNDSVGIKVFTNFLKKEFSEENVVFWKACEDFKNVIDSNYRKSKAREIYDKHVSVRAPDCVNIDSVARKHVEGLLDNPTPQMFDSAQLHIFQLMKQDSYSRFLKSDMYKTYLMKEMEGQPLDLGPVTDNTSDKHKLLDKSNDKDGKKKGGKGKENTEDNKEKRRRSLLPWRQKSKKNTKVDLDTKNVKDNKDKEILDNNNTQKPSGATTNIDPITRKEVLVVEVPETIVEEESVETPKFCRVIMPDGSTTVVGTKPGQTINYVLGKMCEKRNLTIASVDVFLLGSDKPLNLNEDISILGSKEVTIERRVLFRMDLPNKKSIGVKAKPNRLIRDVFKPILNKYGFRIEAIDVHLCGQSDSMCLDNLVSSIDSQRVIVLNSTSDLTPVTVRKNGLIGRYITTMTTTTTRPPLPSKLSASKFGFLGNINKTTTTNNNNHILNNNNDIHSLDELTNQIFGSLMLSKCDNLLAPHNFDELGILDPESARQVAKNENRRPSLDSCGPQKDDQDVAVVSAKDPGKVVKTKQKVTFALQKNTVRNRPNDEDEEALCERLKRAQNLSLDDQRGLAPQDLQLPDFLRETGDDTLRLIGRESAPAALGRDTSESNSSSQPNRDFMSEIDDYIENINENFAAYTRDSTSTPIKTSTSTPRITNDDGRTVHNFRTFGGTPSGKLKFSDKSFSEDGIVPSHEDADNLFQVSTPDNVDFDDPHLTDKSLTDIGFSYGYNKYLSKSRNFVNHHPRSLTSAPTSYVQSDSSSPLVSMETLSPNQTLKGNYLNNSDILESTLRHSPRSSPYSSDSSLDKENMTKYVPKSSVNNVKRTSRHTLIHSPIASDDDSFLSTVDTDGKMTRHSTPNSKSSSSNSDKSVPEIPKVFNTSTDNLNNSILLNHSHTDEVTFV